VSGGVSTIAGRSYLCRLPSQRKLIGSKRSASDDASPMPAATVHVCRPQCTLSTAHPRLCAWWRFRRRSLKATSCWSRSTATTVNRTDCSFRGANPEIGAQLFLSAHGRVASGQDLHQARHQLSPAAWISSPRVRPSPRERLMRAQGGQTPEYHERRAPPNKSSGGRP
jgi:hypothetical protein